MFNFEFVIILIIKENAILLYFYIEYHLTSYQFTKIVHLNFLRSFTMRKMLFIEATL